MSAVVHNTNYLLQRLYVRIDSMSRQSNSLSDAFHRIGLYVSALAKANAERQRLRKTSNLINSIRYELFNDPDKSGVRVGSFNVPYAAVHEFGFSGSVRIPQFNRLQSFAWGRPIDPRMVTVRAHSRFMRIPKRPYLIPAVRHAETFIIDTIRAAISGKG